MNNLEDLKEVLNYDPDTGVFTWKKTLGKKAQKGKRAGSANKNGHITIGYKGKTYIARRLAWAFVHGEVPRRLAYKGEKTDLSISNLYIPVASPSNKKYVRKKPNKKVVKVKQTPNKPKVPESVVKDLMSARAARKLKIRRAIEEREERMSELEAYALSEKAYTFPDKNIGR